MYTNSVKKRGKMKKIDEITMRNMGIFDLRNLARDLGVLSPTTCKKDELIEKILQILSGEKQPEVPKNRQGRPPKARNPYLYQGPTKYSDVIDSNNLRDYDFSSPQEENYAELNDSYQSAPFKYDEKFDFRDGEGYLKQIGENFYLFQNGRVANIENAIIVPAELVYQNNLKDSDYIKCVYKNSINYNARIATKIKNLSDFTKTQDIAEISVQRSDKHIYFSEIIGDVEEGKRIVLSVSSFNKYMDILQEIRERCVDKYHFVNLCIDALPEYNLNFSESFYTLLDDTAKMNALTCEICFSRLSRLIEQGKKVVIFVNELMKMVKYQNFLNNGNIGDIKSYSLFLVSRLMRYAGTYSNGASVTVVALLKDNGMSESLNTLKNELENYNCMFVDYKN